MSGEAAQEFTKHDQGKARWSLLPWDAVGLVVGVLTYGARKYSDHNWKKVDDPSRYEDAALRHFVAYKAGERLDPETKLPHLAHMACNVLFLLWATTAQKDGK